MFYSLYSQHSLFYTFYFSQQQQQQTRLSICISRSLILVQFILFSSSNSISFPLRLSIHTLSLSIFQSLIHATSILPHSIHYRPATSRVLARFVISIAIVVVGHALKWNELQRRISNQSCISDGIILILYVHHVRTRFHANFGVCQVCCHRLPLLLLLL